jgi:phosphoribosylanthranilate isomerase
MFNNFLNNFIVQIYEVQDPTEAQILLDMGVNHIGSVILSENNWKDPLIKETVHVVHASKAKSSLIPLFSNNDTIMRTLDYFQPDIVHFCEDISHVENQPERLDNLICIQENVKIKFPEIKIMRSIPIAPEGLADRVPTIELAGIFESISDYFLTDTLLINGSDFRTGKQPVNNFVGITGIICDWNMAEKLIQSSRIPVILAGGISPDNVFESILQCRPAGIDSCSNTNKVEKGCPVRFKKDTDKVKRLMSETHKAINILKNIVNQEVF